MKRIQLIILPLIIYAFITECNKAQINNEDKQTNNKSAQTSKANDNKENKKSTETNSKNDNSINDEIFFCDWTITGTAASGPITIYSTEDIKKIIVTKIYY